jgi:hypothetical protein
VEFLSPERIGRLQADIEEKRNIISKAIESKNPERRVWGILAESLVRRSPNPTPKQVRIFRKAQLAGLSQEKIVYAIQTGQHLAEDINLYVDLYATLPWN